MLRRRRRRRRRRGPYWLSAPARPPLTEFHFLAKRWLRRNLELPWRKRKALVSKEPKH